MKKFGSSSLTGLRKARDHTASRPKVSQWGWCIRCGGQAKRLSFGGAMMCEECSFAWDVDGAGMKYYADAKTDWKDVPRGCLGVFEGRTP